MTQPNCNRDSVHDPGLSSDRPVRTHGASGPWVIVVHGGPGAPGSAAGLAQGLAPRFRVAEPWQRLSGSEPLTVARHVADLRAVVGQFTEQGRPPALVGHSWGAMLVLAYAADHAGTAGAIVLVGCGTFDEASRERLAQIRDERMGVSVRARFHALLRRGAEDPDALQQAYRLIAEGDDFDSLPADDPLSKVDARGNLETWNDMVRLQRLGVYPDAFRAVTSPVMMVHGDYDPHPGAMIRDVLKQCMPQLEYRELAHCGHYPWRERQARDTFFDVVATWLERQTGRCQGSDGSHPVHPVHRV